jgi:hypothetical protein
MLLNEWFDEWLNEWMNKYMIRLSYIILYNSLIKETINASTRTLQCFNKNNHNQHQQTKRKQTINLLWDLRLWRHREYLDPPTGARKRARWYGEPGWDTNPCVCPGRTGLHRTVSGSARLRTRAPHCTGCPQGPAEARLHCLWSSPERHIIKMIQIWFCVCKTTYTTEKKNQFLWHNRLHL